MTIDELGKLAIKSKKWKWLDGMLAIVPSKHIGGTGYCFRLVGGQEAGNVIGGYPDFSDAKTLEALLTLVQTIWGKEATVVQDNSSLWTIKGAKLFATEMDIGIYAPTELTALLLAIGVNIEE